MSIFKIFEADDIVSANPSEVTVGLWSGNTGSLNAFFTGSQALGQNSGQYYWNVYGADPVTTGSAEIQFAIAYGHRTGGGHPTLLQSDTSLLATQAVYSQWRNEILNPGDTQFTFEGSYGSDHIYVVVVSRALFKERLDAGNWQLTLSGSSGSFTFIDDSGQSLGSAFGKTGQFFNVVSGSLSGSSGATIFSTTSSTKGGFGLFYPSLGAIVFSPDAITQTVGLPSGSYYTAGTVPFAPVTTSQALPQYNHGGLLNAIKRGGDFQARSAEIISSTHYFIRMKAKEYNYSTNPTFSDETNGTLVNDSFIQDPKTYPTTVGLYNDQNELLAVAKLSSATQKSFAAEVAIKARLDF